MANDNRDLDDRNSDKPDEAVVAVSVPLNSTGSGYVPAVVPIVTAVDKENADDVDAVRVEPVLDGDKPSDERIDREINDHLSQHSYIDATELVVTVKNGKVTLEGSVPDADQKNYVEEVAAKIDGVKGIDNRLTLQKPQGTLLQNTSGKQ